MAYDANLIEKRWQEIWDKNEYFEPKDDLTLPKNIFYLCFLIKWSYTYGTCEKL